MNPNEKNEVEVPDPSGLPEPVPEGYTLKKMIGEMFVVTLVGGVGAFFLLAGSMGRTSGSTRSTHLKWQKVDQERIGEIQRVMNKEKRPAD